MGEMCREPGLTQEALAEALVAGELRRQHLERRRPAVHRVLHEVDGAHRPFADQRAHAESADDRAGGDVAVHASSACGAEQGLGRERGAAVVAEARDLGVFGTVRGADDHEASLGRTASLVLQRAGG